MAPNQRNAIASPRDQFPAVASPRNSPHERFRWITKAVDSAPTIHPPPKAGTQITRVPVKAEYPWVFAASASGWPAAKPRFSMEDKIADRTAKATPEIHWRLSPVGVASSRNCAERAQSRIPM